MRITKIFNKNKQWKALLKYLTEKMARYERQLP